MNICGCLVHVLPHRVGPVRSAMAEEDGVEVHTESDDGRIVIVVEDTSSRLASETIMDLHQVPGVISITLTYHHFEEVSESDAKVRQPQLPNAGGQINEHL